MATKGYRTAGGIVSFYDPAVQTLHQSGLWKDCPVLESLHDPSILVTYFDDFHKYDPSATNLILTQATSGTCVPGVLANGVLTIDAGAATDGQGVNLQLAGVDFFPAAGKTLWFETRVKDSFITGDLFFGLAELDTTIIASSAMTTANHIGYKTLTGDGIMLGEGAKASAVGTTAGLVTITAATYTKLGFKVNGVTNIDWYVDNVLVDSTLLTANIPVAGLTPSIVVHATGTNRDVVDVDYIKIAQLR